MKLRHIYLYKVRDGQWVLALPRILLKEYGLTEDDIFVLEDTDDDILLQKSINEPEQLCLDWADQG